MNTMAKLYPSKPFLLMFYGYPGAGKTYFARQFVDSVQSAHLQADRIRGELFEQPRYDPQENDVVQQIMDYMSGEFLGAGLSVAYDVNATRSRQRRKLAELARRYGAQPLLIWFQMDQDTAFGRNLKRDRRRADDKYAARWDRTSFEDVISRMQNPAAGEDYVVVSGKHLFNMQQSAVISRLRSKGVLGHNEANSRVIKPGLVNLVPKTHSRLDNSRRNIAIRNSL
jgi:predicted kinase